MRNCKRCNRETNRSGHPVDGLCDFCDFCVRYGHVDGIPCSRCGFPEYARPAGARIREAG